MASSTKSPKPTEEQTMSQETLTFPVCNPIARIGVDPKHPEYNEICWFLQRSPLQFALTAKPKMSKFLLGNFWLTCSYDDNTKKISASVLSSEKPDVVFDKEDLRTILRLPTFPTYEDFPLGNEHQQVIAALNYFEDQKSSTKSKGSGTLLKKNMGNIWSFFFSHLIHCLSKKTGGFDQSPSYITELAHALIFQRKIDYAAYFFKEIVSSFVPVRRSQVPFHRFFSLIINNKLEKQLRSKDDIEYDLEVHQIGHGVLSKKPLDSDNPLRANMIALAHDATLAWGANEAPIKGPRISVAPPTLSTRADDVPKTRKRKTSGTSSSARKATKPKVPSASTQAPTPSKKRRSSSSPLKISSKKSKAPSRVKNISPHADSQQSARAEFVSSGPRDTLFTLPALTLPSQKDKVDFLGISPRSPTDQPTDEDDLDLSPIQGPSSPPPEFLNLTSQPPHVDTSTPGVSKGATHFLDFLYSDTTSYVLTSPVHTHHDVSEPQAETSSLERHASLHVSPTAATDSATPKSPPILASPKSPINISDSPISPPKKPSPLVDYSSSPSPSPKGGDASAKDIPSTSAPPRSEATDLLLDAFETFAASTGHRVALLEEQATRQMQTQERMDALIHDTDGLFAILKYTVAELSVTHPAMVTCLDLIHLDTTSIGDGVSRHNATLSSALSALTSSHSALQQSVDALKK